MTVSSIHSSRRASILQKLMHTPMTIKKQNNYGNGSEKVFRILLPPAQTRNNSNRGSLAPSNDNSDL